MVDSTYRRKVLQLFQFGDLPMCLALHIKGVENTKADYLSRKKLRQGEWSLSPRVFHQIVQAWGESVIDLFATLHNKKVERFCSLDPRGNPVAVDALRIPWEFSLAYVFPPIALIPVVANVGNRSMDPTGGSGPAYPGSSMPLSSEGLPSGSLEFERALLSRQGFSSGLISTLLRSRKPITSRIYGRTWKRFLEFLGQPLSDEAPVGAILEFLQAGLQLGLATNTLKVQVSALGALYHCNLASNKDHISFEGDGCAFRHSEAALGNETVCTLWKEGRCFRQICKFRHMEIDKKRSEIACYWENQISGCQKANCAFHHIKGRFVDGAYFPPNKAVTMPELCEPDVQNSLPLPAPAKLSVVPTPQLRGVKKMEATENVPSPTHPPVVINAADDDEDDDDQFSEGEEMKNSSQHSVAPGNQQRIHTLSTRKSVKKESTVSSEILVSSYKQRDNSISFQRTVKFTNKDLATNLSLAQRLGKSKKFQGDSPLAASDGEVPPSVKKSLSERLGKRIATPTDSLERPPKKVQISRPLKDRLGLPIEQGNKEAGTTSHLKSF
ncbi:unnamed protein product [Ranitomeya imitator]|uniref:Zinc-finger CCCH domain-containing protein n=1 Tax=Ranitomeya imitator TaxID=111125 RepID=A0ABN9LIZ1_9NEOB|nr:unnamed protein product [Ranitomeya imitator]